MLISLLLLTAMLGAIVLASSTSTEPGQGTSFAHSLPVWAKSRKTVPSKPFIILGLSVVVVLLILLFSRDYLTVTESSIPWELLAKNKPVVHPGRAITQNDIDGLSARIKVLNRYSTGLEFGTACYGYFPVKEVSDGLAKDGADIPEVVVKTTIRGFNFVVTHDNYKADKRTTLLAFGACVLL